MAKAAETQTTSERPIGWIVFGVILWLFFVIGVASLDTGGSTTKKETKPDEVIIDGNGVVRKGFIVCFTPSASKEMLELREQGDINGAMYLHKSNQCFLLKDGVTVSILEKNIMSPSKIRAYMDNGDAVDLYTYFEYK